MIVLIIVERLYIIQKLTTFIIMLCFSPFFFTEHVKGPFDGQDRIMTGYDRELDKDMI
jgi:hypothetical protein